MIHISVSLTPSESTFAVGVENVLDRNITTNRMAGLEDGNLVRPVFYVDNEDGRMMMMMLLLLLMVMENLDE